MKISSARKEKGEPMKLIKAIEILQEKYKQAKGNPQIIDPVAWALYRTWRIADGERKKSSKGVEEI